ncbi:MAG: glycosyltransferase family 39 protein [Myxococcaceae bacterium]|nr:glycosyltransferase family 39 protein [Myxococcaceae bacterium]
MTRAPTAPTRSALVFCAGAAALFLLVVWFRPGPALLYGVDAPIYARVARELAARPVSAWHLPTLQGAEFHEHPPLFFWVEAVVFRIAGATPDAARFTARLFATLVGLFVFGAAWRLSGARAAGLSLLALLLIPGFLYEAQNPMLELPLMAFLACAMCGVAWMETHRAIGVALFAAGFALAFWTKGPPALAALPLVLWWAAQRRTSWWLALVAIGCGIALVVLTFGVFEWVRARHGDPSFLAAWFRGQVVESAVHGRHSPHRSLVYFVPVLLTWHLPALLGVPFAVWAWWRASAARPAIELGGALAAIVFVGFSVPVQKHTWYIHPLIAGAGLYLGASLATLLPDRSERWTAAGACALALLTAVLFAAVPAPFEHRAPEVAAIQRTPPPESANATVAHCGRLGTWQAEHLFAFFWDARRVDCNAPDAAYVFDGRTLTRRR